MIKKNFFILAIAFYTSACGLNGADNSEVRETNISVKIVMAPDERPPVGNMLWYYVLGKIDNADEPVRIYIVHHSREQYIPKTNDKCLMEVKPLDPNFKSIPFDYSEVQKTIYVPFSFTCDGKQAVELNSFLGDY